MLLYDNYVIQVKALQLFHNSIIQLYQPKIGYSILDNTFHVHSNPNGNKTERVGSNLEKGINKICLKSKHDNVTKYLGSCKNKEAFWMNAYNKKYMYHVLMVIVLTLITSLTITYLINPHNAKAAQFKIDKSV